MEQKANVTIEGLNKIRVIKKGINRGRVFPNRGRVFPS